jgi:L-asparagine oxygenase
MSIAIERRTFSHADAKALDRQAHKITSKFWEIISAEPTYTNPELVAAIDRRVHTLPGTIHEMLQPPTTTSGVVVIEGLSVDDRALGPTPSHWSQTPPSVLDIRALLLARCAGEPFGWSGQQAGRLVNNILPSPGQEHEQTGASSAVLLEPHTEDAFHPERANLLMLQAMRNPDGVGTTVSSATEALAGLDQTIRESVRRQLVQAVVPIMPDSSYGYSRLTGTPARPIPTLKNVNGQDYLRFDPAYTPLDAADAEYLHAYERLSQELARVCVTATLQPGELILIDNDIVVHGRVPFAARYDGTDRWLKRVNIRLPERHRDERELGYGQQVVRPFRGAP